LEHDGGGRREDDDREALSAGKGGKLPPRRLLADEPLPCRSGPRERRARRGQGGCARQVQAAQVGWKMMMMVAVVVVAVMVMVMVTVMACFLHYSYSL
jgi:hypothetical protein